MLLMFRSLNVFQLSSFNFWLFLVLWKQNGAERDEIFPERIPFWDGFYLGKKSLKDYYIITLNEQKPGANQDLVLGTNFPEQSWNGKWNHFAQPARSHQPDNNTRFLSRFFFDFGLNLTMSRYFTDMLIDIVSIFIPWVL